MRHFLLAGLIAFGAHTYAQTGIVSPGMTSADNLVTSFLNTHNIPGAVVAMAKDGKIIYTRAFGYADLSATTPTRPYNMFRIASLSKQITAIALMKMVENGQLSLSAKVFGPGGILENHPVFSTTTINDGRIYNITVQQLMEHAGGWNRDLNCNPNPTTPYTYFQSGCDPISFPLRVTQQTGMPNPVTKDALIKFLLQKGLDFTPGTSYNYSNIGYLILGEVIEKISGQPYETYVQNNILAPLGIYDMHIANNLRSEKQEREMDYVGNGFTTFSLYGDGTTVPWEYGGFSVKAMDAHGGWIASARDMLKLLVAVDGFSTKPDILQPSTISSMVTPSANNANYAKGWAVNGANNWWHTGSLDGTASEWVRSSGGYTWVILLNKRQDYNSFWTALDNLGWNIIAATTSWPTFDLMASPTVNASNTSFSGATTTSVTFNWTSGNGDKRMVIARETDPVNVFPMDGTNYTANSTYGTSAIGGSDNYVVYNGTGNSVTVTGLNSTKTYYFRVMEYNQNASTGNNALYLLGANPTASRSMAAALPVNFLYFKAAPQDDHEVRLNWATAQESNNDYFEVQRSKDGIVFATLGKVTGSGNSSVTTQYNYTDRGSFSGKYFYRLKQVDKDGDARYSLTLTVQFDAGSLLTLAPNPVQEYCDVSGAGIQQISLLDQAGKILQSQKAIGNTNRVYMTHLSAGIYCVRIMLQDGKVVTRKIMKR